MCVCVCHVENMMLPEVLILFNSFVCCNLSGEIYRYVGAYYDTNECLVEFHKNLRLKLANAV